MKISHAKLANISHPNALIVYWWMAARPVMGVPVQHLEDFSSGLSEVLFPSALKWIMWPSGSRKLWSCWRTQACMARWGLECFGFALWITCFIFAVGGDIDAGFLRHTEGNKLLASYGNNETTNPMVCVAETLKFLQTSHQSEQVQQGMNMYLCDWWFKWFTRGGLCIPCTEKKQVFKWNKVYFSARSIMLAVSDWNLCFESSRTCRVISYGICRSIKHQTCSIQTVSPSYHLTAIDDRDLNGLKAFASVVLWRVFPWCTVIRTERHKTSIVNPNRARSMFQATPWSHDPISSIPTLTNEVICTCVCCASCCLHLLHHHHSSSEPFLSTGTNNSCGFATKFLVTLSTLKAAP